MGQALPNKGKVKGISRQRTPLFPESATPIPSLVTYRNSYFTSENPADILDFYESFGNADELIKWMRERPKGATYFSEVEGDKSIVVVIPTADANSPHALNCRDVIYAGLHIIFVVSGEIPDPYFNYAYSVNTGIKKAMEYNPEWIVVSNDDMVKIDDPSVLISELRKFKSTDMVVVNQDYGGNIHRFAIAKLNIFGRLFKKLLARKPWNLKPDAGVFKRQVANMYAKGLLGIDFDLFYDKELGRPYFHLLHGRLEEHLVLGHFMVFGQDYIRKIEHGPFDESFINAVEDCWLGVNLERDKVKLKHIDYKLDSLFGKSLGIKLSRTLRDLSGYINFEMKNGGFK